MGYRQSLVRSSALVGLLACGAPPQAGFDAGADVVDAAPPDALVCAEPPHASAANPHGIYFTDVTDTWAGRIEGGRKVPDPYAVGSGVALADLDGDGDLDAVLARYDEPGGEQAVGPSLLLINRLAEEGRFTAAPGLGELLAGRRAHGVAIADYDGDGDQDVFFACAGPDVLLRNDGSGAFEDVTAVAGLSGPDDDVTVGAVWADVNADGLLDLYALSNVVVVPPGSDARNANRLYLNRGGGSFGEVGVVSGASGDGSTQAALISDLDDDGELEIYVANDRFASGGPGVDDLQSDAVLDPTGFDAEGVPTYVDRSAAYGTAEPRSSMGVALADLDADGDDDLYVTDIGANHVQLWNADARVYASDAGSLGIDDREYMAVRQVSWAARFLDLDRDGALELFVVNGSFGLPPCTPELIQPDNYFRSTERGGAFSLVTPAVGLPFAVPCEADVPVNGRGAAFGDLDGDGDDDLVVSPYAEVFRFYRNDTPRCGRHFVRVRLRGTLSAPDPVGAVFEVEHADGSTTRRRLYAGGEIHSQSDRVLEIALDDATEFTRAMVRWPSGVAQSVGDLLVVDGEVEIEEPADERARESR